MTRAYGTRPLIIKGCYLLLFALGAGFSISWARGWPTRWVRRWP